MNDETRITPSPDQPSRLTDWANEPSLQDLVHDLESAKPSQSSQVDRIQRWNDLLLVRGKAKPRKLKGRSAVQPKLIRLQAEWRYSALTEPFLSSEKIFQVSPRTFEDQEAARQNELVLNWQLQTKLNPVKFIDDLVRSTVDEGTSIVRLGWVREVQEVEDTVPVFDYYPLQTEEQQQQLQQALALRESDPRSFNEQVPETLQAAVEYFEETQVPTVAVVSGSERVLREEILENKPTLLVVNPANVFIDPSCNGNLDAALFVVYSFETNRAELAREPDRYRNLDQVPWEHASVVAEPDHETSTPDHYNLQDGTRRKVVAYEYWGYYDIHDNQTLVPIVATWIGNTLIRLEENPFPDGKPPFVVVPYLPVKRELYGEPDAELLEDNQAIAGAVTRGMIDLLGRSANSQQGFAKGMLDPLNRRRYENGQDYEFNTNIPPDVGIKEHKYPEIPQSAMLMLGLQNQTAEALTGVKSFSGGLSGEAYGKVATGIRGMLDAASKREMAILRRLAQGMVQIGQKLIAMNALFLSEEEVVRVTNEEFVLIQREDLKGNFDLKVDISTAEIDEAKAQDLSFMLQTIGPNMDPTIYTRILSEIAELKRMPKLAQELRTWQPEPDPVAERMRELELLELEKRIQKLDSEILLNQAQAQKASADADLKNLDFVEQETGTKHAREMDRHQSQSRGNQDLEITKALARNHKPDEQPGDVAAAIGFNRLTDLMSNSGQFNQINSTMSRDANSPRDPRLNIQSPQYDPQLDPAMNAAINI